MSDTQEAREQFEAWKKTLPKCLGYESGCDGDLEGEQHSPNCPLEGKGYATHFDAFGAGWEAALSRSAEPTTQIEHTRSCPALNIEDHCPGQCSCGLEFRIQLQTEREMHNAWRKRAEEAEKELESRSPSTDDKEFYNETRRVMFRAGLLACREYMARFVESESPSIAASIRANWWPCLGDDPGAPRKLRFDEVTDGGENGPWPMKEISPSIEALPVAMAFLVNPPIVAPSSSAPEGTTEIYSRPECPFNYCDTQAPHSECLKGCHHAPEGTTDRR